MSDATRDDEQVQNAIRSLFEGGAPERVSDLASLWQLLSPKFQLTPDLHEGERLVMDAGAYRYVRFNHRVVRAFWLGAFAAWEGYRAVVEDFPSQPDLSRFRTLLAAFSVALESDAPALEPLPQGVPEPGTYVDRNEHGQARAAAELATIATCWALLHEVRHIKHQQEGTGADSHVADPAEWRTEELSCDRFATEFLLDNAGDYAGQCGVDAALVMQKRQLSIYFALFTMTLLADGRWHESDSHPSIQARMDAVQSVMAARRSEVAEAIAHVAFAALRFVLPEAPAPKWTLAARDNTSP